MTLTLNPQTEQRIQRELDRGHYADPSEVIAHALDLLDDQEDWLMRNKDAINDRLKESLAQAERGEVYTPDEAARILDARIANHVR